MKCIKCNEELEADDNFCPTCGELTPHGYLSLKDNITISVIIEFVFNF